MTLVSHAIHKRIKFSNKIVETKEESPVSARQCNAFGNWIDLYGCVFDLGRGCILKLYYKGNCGLVFPHWGKKLQPVQSHLYFCQG